MNLSEIIKDSFSNVDLLTPYKITLFGENAVYIEGAKRIIEYSKEEIVIELKKDFLFLRGENLYIKKYCEGDVAVCGKVCFLEKKREINAEKSK